MSHLDQFEGILDGLAGDIVPQAEAAVAASAVSEGISAHTASAASAGISADAASAVSAGMSANAASAASKGMSTDTAPAASLEMSADTVAAADPATTSNIPDTTSPSPAEMALRTLLALHGLTPAPDALIPAATSLCATLAAQNAAQPMQQPLPRAAASARGISAPASWRNMTLTDRAALYRQDPALARRMARESGEKLP